MYVKGPQVIFQVSCFLGLPVYYVLDKTHLVSKLCPKTTKLNWLKRATPLFQSFLVKFGLVWQFTDFFFLISSYYLSLDLDPIGLMKILGVMHCFFDSVN